MWRAVSPVHRHALNLFLFRVAANLLVAKDMVPALVDAIKSHGLYLVVDKSADDPRPEITPFADPFPRLPNGIDGVLKRNGVLRFNESINV